MRYGAPYRLVMVIILDTNSSANYSITVPVPMPVPVLPVTVLAQHGRACRVIRLQGTGEPVDRWSMLVNRHSVKDSVENSPKHRCSELNLTCH